MVFLSVVAYFIEYVMTKKSAHIVLFVFDVVALLSTLWIVDYVSMTHSDIALGSDAVEFESSILYILLLLVIPVIHLLSFSDRRKLAFFRLVNKYQIYVFSCCIVMIFSSKYIVQHSVESDFKLYGYIKCSEIIKGRYHREFYQKNNCNN